MTIASQGLFFLLFWKTYQPQRIKLISTFAGMLICLLPLTILLGNRVSITTSGFWISQPSVGNIFDTLLVYSSGLSIPMLSPEDTVDTFYSISKFILLFIFLGLGIFSMFSIKKKKDKRKAKKISHRSSGNNTSRRIGIRQ